MPRRNNAENTSFYRYLWRPYSVFPSISPDVQERILLSTKSKVFNWTATEIVMIIHNSKILGEKNESEVIIRGSWCLTCIRRFDWLNNNDNIDWPMRRRARESTDSTCIELPNRNDTNTAAMRDENEELCKFATLSLSAMSKEVSLIFYFYHCCWILMAAKTGDW